MGFVLFLGVVEELVGFGGVIDFVGGDVVVYVVGLVVGELEYVVFGVEVYVY